MSDAPLHTTAAMDALLPTMQLALRGTLALLLLAAAVHKLRDLTDFERVVGAYALIPKVAIRGVARLVPGLEITAAALLTAPLTAAAGAGLAFALLAAYSAALAVSLARGRRDIDCGCGGFGAHQTVHFGLLLRNAALLLAAAFCGLSLSGAAVAQLSAAVPAALAAVLLYAATDQLMANAAFRRSLDA